MRCRSVPLARLGSNQEFLEKLRSIGPLDAVEEQPAPFAVPLITAEAPRPFAGPNRRLTEPEIDELVVRYEAGARNIDLSRELQIDPSTTWKHLRDRGIESTYQTYCDWDPELLEIAVLMYVEGATLKEIGQIVQRAPNTVRRRLLAEGVELRTRGRRPS